MNKNMNLQEVFLNQARRDRMPITVILVNGYQFKATVVGFDNYCIVFDCEGKQEWVFKHAISTMVPARPVNIFENNSQD